MAQQEDSYRLEDADTAREMLRNDDFIEAYATAARLLGACLAFSPKNENAERSLQALREVDIAADWPFGAANAEAGLLQAAELIALGACEDGEALATEYQRLFVGPGHLAAPPWGSVYMDHDKVLYGCTWVELREWMRAYDIEAEYNERVPEDQIGRLLVMSADVAQGCRDALPELLGDHILPWAGHYFDLLAAEARLATYQGVALLAKATLSDMQALLGITPANRRLYR